jgi:hypothetical protein
MHMLVAYEGWILLMPVSPPPPPPVLRQTVPCRLLDKLPTEVMPDQLYRSELVAL